MLPRAGEVLVCFSLVLSDISLVHDFLSILATSFFTLLGVYWKMTIYASWQNYWAILWLIVHLELAILS
jgi:hypothetical protein